MSLDISRN